MTIREIIATVRDRYDAGADEYLLKQVAEDAFEEAKDQGLDDETLMHAINLEVKRQDEQRHLSAQLTFGPWSFGTHLNLGEGERIGIESAKLAHVIRDDELFDEQYQAMQARKAERDSRTRALMPYLAKGMTVPEATAAWEADHQALDLDAD